MTSIHSRAQLENLKRGDLQRLCKDYGLRANLKTEALIELILGAATPSLRKSDPPPEQRIRRSASTRLSSRSTAPRTSSVIIHNTDHDEDPGTDIGGGEPAVTGATSNSQRESAEQQPPTLPRTRKAKDTQRRLGVGRPIAAGGSGARAATKSMSVTKSRRGKGSRSVAPVEATIPEEETGVSEEEELCREKNQTEGFTHTEPEMRNDFMFGSGQELERRVHEALQPILKQLESMKAEIEQYKSVRGEISQLRTKVIELSDCREKIETLTLELKQLREKASSADSLQAEVQDLKEALSRLSPVATRSPIDAELASGFRTPTNNLPNATPSHPSTAANASNHSSAALPHPGFAPMLLGKRQRDSTVSSMTDMVEEGQEGDFSAAELARKVVRPNRKRARTGSPDGDPPEIESGNEDPDEAHQPGFVVYNDRTEVNSSFDDPPPPTTPLPRVYGTLSPPDDAGPSRNPSTRNTSQNQHPFGFSFLAVPPTPHASSFMTHNFPYPEPPQSPTPGGSDHLRNPDNHGGHQDIFQSLGLPPLGRTRSLLTPSRRTASSDARNFVNPAALTGGTESDRGEQSTGGISSDEVGALDAGDAPAVKRTMYGTELESDTRFGDFGVEGVASGFWTGSGRF
ncbi:hypothetical protein E1B28_001201 [Marasmius oreades]|uniref:Uncharacterized protein n=1 Tax=Marasmius oreades TaxID=181124 RepID=A0A9P8AFE5_9AGAR|nr:uncharacterized protein E1B28_001201 [Marasmius oreades]KAG7099345.1 hypothetical protein E1B28_001201 [Marasmius oreades]